MSDDEDLGISPEEEARIDAILHSMTEHDLVLDVPPDSVWAGIEARVAPSTATPPAEEQPIAAVTDLAARRNRRFGVFAGAIAAALALIVGIGVVVSSDGAPTYEEFATAELAFDPATFDPGGQGRSASTTLLVADDRQQIRFDAADLPDPVAGEDIELWLIGFDTNDEIEVIQPVGFVENVDAPGTFDVPEEFSFDDYATVALDLSFEPRDGDETHSGRSILRGPLRA